jgi:PIN domain nuclease of toxin-antitoxin system
MLLLDTHVVLWLISAPSKLSKNGAHAIIEARQNGEALAISGMTLLELATLSTKGRIGITGSLDSVLHDLETHFTVLPITARACARIPAFPASYSKDPADRIIGATALAEGLTLLTADRNIRRYRALTTIW